VGSASASCQVFVGTCVAITVELREFRQRMEEGSRAPLPLRDATAAVARAARAAP
jgi:hypothetical protein